MVAYYHAGPDQQRVDLGHTLDIGEPWTKQSLCTHLLISLPYAYGPELEICAGPTGHARILAVQPITPAERAFKIEHGVEALEQRLEEAEAAFANPSGRPWFSGAAGARYALLMAARERVNVDLDTEVAAILRKHAAEAHVSEGEILDRALRAYDLRALLARLQAQSDLDEEQAMGLAREELKAARAARRAPG